MQPRPVPTVVVRVALALALVSHALIALPLLTVGLVAPWYGVIAFWLFWGLMLWALLRLRRTRPLLVPLVPIVTAAALFGMLVFGGEVLGWTA